MNYVVVSERVGKPGEPFKPQPGTNIEALLAYGFIAEVSTPKPKTSPKVKTSTKEKK
jgi:hypothetical protein